MGASSNFVFDRRHSVFSSLSGFGPSLLGLQKSINEPDVDELKTGTSLLNPSMTTHNRLAHFPDEIFNKREDSHFVRFMKAILGDAGAGQLRKRLLVMRMWSILSSTHFYDLDRFYGAIFGVTRRPDELLPINPMEELATPDGWDEISTFDARYREKIIQLAKAITMGGTVPGMKAISEALTGAECDVYEIWSLIDTAGELGFGRTWQQVAVKYVNYANLEGRTWGEVENRPVFGQMGNNVRNEFVIRPKKTYSDDAEGRIERAYDINGIKRVVRVLMPADAICSVDERGVAVRQQTPIANISADSEFWDVVPRVIPDPEKESLYTNTKNAYDARRNPSGYQQSKPAQGKVPFYEFIGQAWSHVPDIRVAEAWWNISQAQTQFSWRHLGELERRSRTTGESRSNNYDIQSFNGRMVRYSPNKSYIDPASAVSGNVAGDGTLIVSPYSGTRTSIGNHD